MQGVYAVPLQSGAGRDAAYADKGLLKAVLTGRDSFALVSLGPARCPGDVRSAPSRVSSARLTNAARLPPTQGPVRPALRLCEVLRADGTLTLGLLLQVFQPQGSAIRGRVRALSEPWPTFASPRPALTGVQKAGGDQAGGDGPPAAGAAGRLRREGCLLPERDRHLQRLLRDKQEALDGVLQQKRAVEGELEIVWESTTRENRRIKEALFESFTKGNVAEALDRSLASHSGLQMLGFIEGPSPGFRSQQREELSPPPGTARRSAAVPGVHRSPMFESDSDQQQNPSSDESEKNGLEFYS
ncbi:hypothetical protein SKAU_G00306940 [Synaphobranchus kaupii]|uniref:Uncharacterized protein n=1 Tax=Synaphobranchus kaupii TaxID=118154 RepID=A0A9Q1ER09_SYNKA|nr:hypothetical protein SKAU_G00306940 [Synaphobranchus kaupii]